MYVIRYSIYAINESLRRMYIYTYILLPLSKRCLLIFNIASIIVNSNLTVKLCLLTIQKTILYKNFLLPSDDIPIQVIKDDTIGEGKSNLVSISEEQESTEPNRIGSMRQSKDQKTASKITNFPVLGKKPKDKEGKVPKSIHVVLSEKEKKLGSQTTSKENIKGSLSMLNSEQQAEVDGNINGCAIRKKNNSVENNTIIIDSNVALIENERLALGSDVTEGNMENSINLRAHNETESIASSIQVSSV